jgi:hypothetical protein
MPARSRAGIRESVLRAASDEQAHHAWRAQVYSDVIAGWLPLRARCVRRSTSLGVATGISPRALLDPRCAER